MPAKKPPAVTVRIICAHYCAHSRSEQSDRTFEDRKRIIDAFVAAHGDIRIVEARPFHLRLWVDSHEKWKSDWTKKRVISTVQRCFNWAVKLGIIERNPFAGISQREGEPGRAMTDEEFSSALRSSSVPFRRLLIFLRYTGARPSECAEIEISHVDFDRSTIILGKHKTIRTRRQRKPRVLILHPIARRLVQSLIRSMVPHQTKLFINSRGNPWTRYALACRMQALRKRIGLPNDCKIYGLRHKFGTDAIKAGVELKTLSILMGHTTTRMTERYVHLDGDLDHLKKAISQAMGK